MVHPPTERQRLSQIDAKLDMILNHLGIEYLDPSSANSLSQEVRSLADAGRKIEAIKAHRLQTRTGLREAKQAIDAYIEARREGVPL